MRARDLVSACAAATAAVVAVLVIGGALRWTQAIIGILAAISIVPLVRSRRGLAHASPLVVVLGLATVATAVQLIPLPAPLLDVLQPVGNALRDDGSALVGVSPWHALTLDAPATLRALGFFVTLFGLAIVSLRVSATSQGRYWTCTLVGLLCGAAALVVGAHKLLGLRTLYGLYDSEHADPHLLGPLLNLNHLGCLMAVGATLCTGLVMHPRQASWLRALWLVIGLGCALVTVATISRGATLSLAVGVFVSIATLLAQAMATTAPHRQRRSQLLTSSVPIAIVAMCTVILVIVSNASNVADQLAHTSLDELDRPTTKFAAWRSAAQLIDEAPWTGVGRGAFEPVFTRIHPASAVVTFSHVENEYLQAVVDWGIPVALGLGLAMLWLAVSAIRRWRDGPLAAGALGALSVIAIQSTVDFGVELPGIAIPAVALASTLVYVPIRELQPRALGFRRVSRVLLAVALIGCALSFLLPATTSVDEDHQVLRAPENSSVKIKASIERHPLDYFGYAKAAEQGEQARDPAAIGLLNHAMLLHPSHPGLHRAAARTLLRLGYRTQAMAEYAEALRRAPQAKDNTLAEVLARFNASEAATTIPLDYRYRAALVNSLVQSGHVDVAVIWLDRVVANLPDDPAVCNLVFSLVPRDPGAVNVAVRSCANSFPDHATRLALVKRLAKTASFDKVLTLLRDVEDWRGNVVEKVDAWLALCDAHLELRAWDEAKRCLRRLDTSPDLPPERRPEVDQRMVMLDKRQREAAMGPHQHIDMTSKSQ